MRGYIHNQVVGRDTIGSDGRILRKALYDPDNLPTGISAEMLLQLGYQRLNCRFENAEKEFIVDVLSRKLVVINGIPFYSSSGTSDDYSVISPAWRKNVWMPFMGYEVQGKKPGRISKLGDKVSKSFEAFAEKLVQDWAKTVSDEELRLLWKPQNRGMFGRRETLEDLSNQIKRFGAIEAFSLSMQLLPDAVWAGEENTGENFTALRSLRDYYLTHSPNTYSKVSDDLIAEVTGASFEPINENYHIVESTEPHQYQLVNRGLIREPIRKERVQQENREEAHAINRKLYALGVNISYVARLNNPEAEIQNTLAANIGALIFSLRISPTSAEKENWDRRIEEIVKNLLSLEQEVDVEYQIEKYKIIFHKILPIVHELKNCHNIAEMSRALRKLDEIDSLNHVDAKTIQEEMLHRVYQEYLSTLKQLTEECMQHIDKKKPAYAVLIKLNELLDKTAEPPKKRIEHFFQHLLDNDSENLKLLENDKSRDMKKFIKGIGIITAIIFTGIIPGLVISGAIYAATYHSVFDFFKPHQKGKDFSDKVNEIKNKI